MVLKKKKRRKGVNMAKKRIQKTNAMRFLDQKKKSYEVFSYDYDENNLGALHVCKEIEMPIEKVYKTLIFKGNKSGYIVAFVQGDLEIDEKKLAKQSGDKKVELIPQKDVEKVTGYIRGGVSPLGLKKQFPMYADERINCQEKICFSAGKRGLQIFIDVLELKEVCKMNVCDLV